MGEFMTQAIGEVAGANRTHSRESDEVAPASTKSRSLAIDRARGLGIALVVWSHAATEGTRSLLIRFAEILRRRPFVCVIGTQLNDNLPPQHHRDRSCADRVFTLSTARRHLVLTSLADRGYPGYSDPVRGSAHVRLSAARKLPAEILQLMIFVRNLIYSTNK